MMRGPRIVAVLGPDGVGKSTILAECRKTASRLLGGEAVTSFHLRPHFGRGGGQPVTGRPNRKRRKSPLWLALRHLYWFLDYWLWWAVATFRGRPILAFVDRHPIDLKVDPGRYGAGESPPGAFLLRWIPRLSVAVLLTASAKTIALRKGEVTEEEAREILERYRAIDAVELYEVTNDRPIDVVAAEVLALVGIRGEGH